MLRSTYKSLFGFIAAAVVSVGGLVSVAQAQYTLNVNNDSVYMIKAVVIQGSNILQTDVLKGETVYPGESFWVRLPAGIYSIAMVDGDNLPCAVMNFSITGNETWRITTQWLAACEVNTVNKLTSVR